MHKHLLLSILLTAGFGIGCGEKTIDRLAASGNGEEKEGKEAELGFRHVTINFAGDAYPHKAVCFVGYVKAGDAQEKVHTFKRSHKCAVTHFDGKKSSCTVKAKQKTCKLKVRAQVKKRQVRFDKIKLKLKKIKPRPEGGGTFAYAARFPRYSCNRDKCVIEHGFTHYPTNTDENKGNNERRPPAAASEKDRKDESEIKSGEGADDTEVADEGKGEVDDDSNEDGSTDVSTGSDQEEPRCRHDVAHSLPNQIIYKFPWTRGDGINQARGDVTDKKCEGDVALARYEVEYWKKGEHKTGTIKLRRTGTSVEITFINHSNSKSCTGSARLSESHYKGTMTCETGSKWIQFNALGD